ncbi:MAG: hypothetical protein WCK90_00675 [archaeon]
MPLSETLKILLAVLCIIILLILAYKLYGIFVAKTAVEQAKETLKQIVDEAAALKDGQSKIFLIQSPKTWALSSWPYIPASGNVLMPNDCVNKQWKSCICLCEYPTRAQQLGSVAGALAKDTPAALILSGGTSLTNPLEIFSAEKGVLAFCNNVGVCIGEGYEKFLVTIENRNEPYPILIDKILSTNMSVKGNVLELRKNG